MRRHLALGSPILLWAQNASAHGGELLLLFAVPVLAAQIVFGVFLARWRGSASQKVVVLGAYFGSYLLLLLLSPTMSGLAIWIAFICLPLLVSLTVAWALLKEDAAATQLKEEPSAASTPRQAVSAKCSRCLAEVAFEAPTCPHCGFRFGSA
jgi:hypothetical protein